MTLFVLKRANHSRRDPRSIVRAKIDSSIKKIAQGTFQNCQQLKNVDFSEGLVEIENNAFKHCSSLDSIFLPSTTRSLGQHVFEGCERLWSVTFNEGLEEIRFAAFQESGIESLHLPSTVQYIGHCAFFDCKSLKEANLNEGLRYLKCEAFSGSAIESICLPSTVAKLGRKVFASCHQLRNVTLQEGLEEIRDSCFSGTAIESIALPSTVRIVGSHAFEGCLFLKTVKLNEGLVEIRDGAFTKCPSLTDAYVPSTVEELSPSAFDENVRVTAGATKNELDIFSLDVSSIHDVAGLDDNEAWRTPGLIEEAIAIPHDVVLYKASPQIVPKDACKLPIGRELSPRTSKTQDVMPLTQIMEDEDGACKLPIGREFSPRTSKAQDVMPLTQIMEEETCRIIDSEPQESVGGAILNSTFWEESVMKNTPEETRRLREDLHQISTLAKQIQISIAEERENQIASIRCEFRQTLSDRDGELQRLCADLKQADDRTRMAKYEIEFLKRELKEEVSKRDGEIKMLREGRDEDKKEMRELRNTVSTLQDEAKRESKELRDLVAALQETVGSLKREPTVESVPLTPEGGTARDQRANKRRRAKMNLRGKQL